MPALAPTLLNICWLFAAWAVAPWFAPDKQSQAYVIAAAVLVAGGHPVAAQRLEGGAFESDLGLA